MCVCTDSGECNFSSYVCAGKCARGRVLELDPASQKDNPGRLILEDILLLLIRV